MRLIILDSPALWRRSVFITKLNFIIAYTCMDVKIVNWIIILK